MHQKLQQGSNSSRPGGGARTFAGTWAVDASGTPGRVKEKPELQTLNNLSFLAGLRTAFIWRVSRGAVLIRYWLPVLVWMAVIFAGSGELGSTQRTSRIIGPLLRWLKPDISEGTLRRVQLVIRKGGHMIEYAVLALLLWRARRQPVRNDPRPWNWKEAGFALGGAALYAFTDEFHQSFVSSRQGQWTDVGIDVSGALLGLVLLWGWGRRQHCW